MQDGRKHIKYSCMFTKIYDEIVIQNVYSNNGKEFEYDFSKTFDEIEARHKKQFN